MFSLCFFVPCGIGTPRPCSWMQFLYVPRLYFNRALFFAVGHVGTGTAAAGTDGVQPVRRRCDGGAAGGIAARTCAG